MLTFSKSQSIRKLGCFVEHKFLMRVIICTHIWLTAYFHGNFSSLSHVRNLQTYKNRQLHLVAASLIAWLESSVVAELNAHGSWMGKDRAVSKSSCWERLTAVVHFLQILSVTCTQQMSPWPVDISIISYQVFNKWSRWHPTASNVSLHPALPSVRWWLSFRTSRMCVFVSHNFYFSPGLTREPNPELSSVSCHMEPSGFTLFTTH